MLLPGLARTAPFSPSEIQFFETRIRPVLVEQCYECHSTGATKHKAGLYVDSRSAMIRGGDSGPALVSGRPDQSLLIQGIRYEDVDFQMPPDSRLEPKQIQDFEEWVRMGAPWPEESPDQNSPRKEKFNLQERKQNHWAWRPVHRPPLPSIDNESWPLQPPDFFILHGLETAGIQPASPAAPRTLVRRLHFVLTGLPPTPEEVDSFLHESPPDALERRVDALLRSDRFGEHWARHWLDLVRYAETLGHEFDYPLPNAWRYRDYVIRAFNEDVPYDQFTREHLAGDLLPAPRIDPATGRNESIVGTAFYWLGQQVHSPVDLRAYQLEVIDNQIDVLTKTFQAMTVSCARCHDHKFDAISTRDFYGLYGVMKSSRYAQLPIHNPLPESWEEQMMKSKRTLRNAVGNVWKLQLASLADTLMKLAVKDPDDSEGEGKKLEIWREALKHTESLPLNHPVRDWAPPLTRKNGSDTKSPHAVVFTSTPVGEIDRWFRSGVALRHASAPGDFVVDTGQKRLILFDDPGPHSGSLSLRLQGSLRSPVFRIDQRYVHVRAAGRGSRVNLVIDNFNLIRAPIYGGLKKRIDSPFPYWISFDLDMWQGHEAYLEFKDETLPDLADTLRSNSYPEDAWFHLNTVVFSPETQPPGSPRPSPPTGIARRHLSERAQKIQAQTQAALVAWMAQESGAEHKSGMQMLAWLSQHDLLPIRPDHPEVSAAFEQWAHIESRIPAPDCTPGMTEGTGVDEYVFIRGNPEKPGDQVPRGFLEALRDSTLAASPKGSGRFQLACQIATPDNPLTSRVIVNRVWHHLFGRGIVATTDDFGVLGEAPTHPELLDWLADWFVNEGEWSLKRLIKRLVTSRTWQMATVASDPEWDTRDPTNRLWHQMSLRRHSGEVLRDTMLQVSGSLETRMFGPPPPVHLTPFMTGRGRPGKSGPLDGNNRRSIYQEIRRNFLPPLMQAFDTPLPASTFGRRAQSNVPAQALILMNDPLVRELALRWAQRLLQDPDIDPEARIRQIYDSALGRPPTPAEKEATREFLARQESVYQALHSPEAERQLWADLCQVVFNLKEFIFLN